MRKAFILSPNSKRKDCDCLMFDTESLKTFQLDINDEAKKLDIKNKKYTIGVVHHGYKVYGLLRDSGAKLPNLIFVTEAGLKEFKDDIINYDKSGYIIDISDKGPEVFNGNFNKSLFKSVKKMDETTKKWASTENFLLKLGINTTEQTTETVEQRNETAEQRNETVEQRNETVEQRNETVEQTETKIEKHNSKINENTEKEGIHLNFLNEDNRIQMEIREDRYSTDSKLETTVSKKSDSIDYSIYKSIIKVLRVNDTISIPKDFYMSLVRLIKRNITLSRNGEDYIAIVKLKLDRKDTDNIVVRADFNSKDEYTTIAVIKQFNSVDITDDQIAEYEVKYSEWRKAHSFFIS